MINQREVEFAALKILKKKSCEQSDVFSYLAP